MAFDTDAQSVNRSHPGKRVLACARLSNERERVIFNEPLIRGLCDSAGQTFVLNRSETIGLWDKLMKFPRRYKTRGHRSFRDVSNEARPKDSENVAGLEIVYSSSLLFFSSSIFLR